MRQSRRYLIALGVASVALSGCSSLLGSSASGTSTTVKYVPSKVAPVKKPVPLPDLGPILGKTTGTTALAAPQLVVGLSSFDFGSRNTEHALEIHNSGDLPLTWTSSSSVSYLTVSPAGGSIAGNSSAIATVTLNRASHFGSFTAVITIKSAAGTATVQVTGT